MQHVLDNSRSSFAVAVQVQRLAVLLNTSSGSLKTPRNFTAFSSSFSLPENCVEFALTLKAANELLLLGNCQPSCQNVECRQNCFKDSPEQELYEKRVLLGQEGEFQTCLNRQLFADST